MEEASVVAQRMASVVVDRHIDRVLAEAGF
jgi:hypothetical protein